MTLKRLFKGSGVPSKFSFRTIIKAHRTLYKLLKLTPPKNPLRLIELVEADLLLEEALDLFDNGLSTLGCRKSSNNAGEPLANRRVDGSTLAGRVHLPDVLKQSVDLLVSQVLETPLGGGCRAVVASSVESVRK